MKLIIYLPAFNEEGNIEQVIATLPRELDHIDEIELLVIDDGSKDRTAELSQAAGAHVISHTRNRGVGAVFGTSIQYALENDADVMVGIDADGQFDSSQIPELLKPILLDHYDMVIGRRFDGGRPKNMPVLKFWGNKMVSVLISSISGQKFSDVSCGFRAYGREALFRLNVFSKFTYTHESILSMVYQGLRVTEVPVNVSYDPGRKSRVAGSLLNYAIQTVKIIIRILLDYRAMRVFGTIGSIFVGFGALCVIALFIYYFISGNFTPYKAVGFIGLGFTLFGMMIWLVALVSDLLNRMRINMDQQLYETKKMRYGRNK